MNETKKERILLVHNYYRIPGGEDTVVKNERRLLEDNGHKVILYTRNNSEINTLSLWQKIFLPVTAIFSIKTYREVKKIIRKNQINVVHVHNTLSLVSPSVFFAAFACGIPVVQTLHNFRMLCPNGLFYREGHICEDCSKKGLWCSAYHRCYRNSLSQTTISALILKTHRMLRTYYKVNFICLTEFNKRKLLQINRKGKRPIINPERIFVKPNFADIEKNIIPYEDRENQCVFAGRLEEIKGVRILLQAWSEMEDIDLILCGDGPLMDWCKEYIESNRLYNVKLNGHVAYTELVEIISKSKALILPSIVYEGFPMTIVESMACGTPVICSDLGNPGNLIINGLNGLKFEKGSSKDLCAKVRNLYDMAAACQQFYKKNYTKSENYNRLLDIYREVVWRWDSRTS